MIHPLANLPIHHQLENSRKAVSGTELSVIVSVWLENKALEF